MSRVIIGTYTTNESKGLYACSTRDGGDVSLVAEIDNPSYLHFSRRNRRLYVVSESAIGKVSCYAVSGETLIGVGRLATDSAGLVHVAEDTTGRYLFTASYEDGRVQMIRLSEYGAPEVVTHQVEHAGKGVNPERQERAHAHSVWLTPDGKELCVCDLGIDTVVVYGIDYGKERLVQRKERSVRLPDGSGPRHMVFSPKVGHAYVLAELTHRVFAYSWAPEAGFSLLGAADLLDESDAASTSAAIRMSGDGKFLYASCRGKDVVVVFAVQEDGRLRRVQSVSVRGKHPRDIILAENDAILLCANRDTNNVTVFARNAGAGELTFQHSVEGIPNPIALAIVD